jgi:obg-like ATPase 1
VNFVRLLSVGLQDYIRKKNKWLIKIHEWVQANGGDPIIPFSGAYENEVRCMAVGLDDGIG